MAYAVRMQTSKMRRRVDHFVQKAIKAANSQKAVVNPATSEIQPTSAGPNKYPA